MRTQIPLNSQASTSPTIEVADFPVSSPKFTKSAWDGEGSGQGEG